MTFCERECASMSIFVAKGCPCHEQAYAAIAAGSTETNERGRTGVRVAPEREKRNEGVRVTTRFVRNSTGTKIHERGCKSIKNPVPWHWAEGKTYTEIVSAIPAGVTECGHCQPLSCLALTEALIARFSA